MSAPRQQQRRTVTHGCFDIDGLPRRAVPESERRRWYAAREIYWQAGPPLPLSSACSDRSVPLLTQSERSAYDRDGFVVCSSSILSSAEIAYHKALWESCLRYELGGAELELSAATAAVDTEGDVPTSRGGVRYCTPPHSTCTCTCTV
jgi:hypothetical protein